MVVRHPHGDCRHRDRGRFFNGFCRKSSCDVALVRSGFGGQRVVLSGGCLALPFLHKVEEINMRTNRVKVSAPATNR